MNYEITGEARAHGEAKFSVRHASVPFGIAATDTQPPNPAELLLGSFAACCLKNIERFSQLLKFDYESVRIEVTGVRQDAPPKLVAIRYAIQIKSRDDQLNISLLEKNMQKHGTIYNTLKEVCDISGSIEMMQDQT